jgi:hypothetical protein
MEKDRLSRQLLPIVPALCPFADRLTAASARAIADEVAATLALQPIYIRAGLRAFLWALDGASWLRRGKSLAGLTSDERAQFLARGPLPLWGLVRKLLGTLIALSAFDYLAWQKESDARNAA